MALYEVFCEILASETPMILCPGLRAAAMKAAMLATMTPLERLLYAVDKELRRAARLIVLR